MLFPLFAFLLAVVSAVLGQSRLQVIQSMYAWEGFVYSVESCKSVAQMTADFQVMKARGARTVITFDYCGSGAEVNFYDGYITAAENAGLWIIPCVWTLPIHPVGQNFTANDTFAIKSVPRIHALTQAVINHPGPVLAVALGDEPLFDNDAGSPDALASFINSMRSSFQSAGLSIPISISDLAFGWQSAGNITSMLAAVDIFMINNFPYFAFDATTGGSTIAWNDFMNDMNWFSGVAGGKPLLVTQTGWPSNKNEFSPNSPNIVASVASEMAYWNLLDSHCTDFFGPRNIGWMWRAWNDEIDGWGVKFLNGTDKWNWSAKLTC